MNIFSVQLPSPVSGSGVRLAVKLIPQGPANAVFVAAPAQAHGAASAGGGGSFTSCGCPLSMRLVSGSGPLAPIFIGVWQSLHPMILERYRPRLPGPLAVSDWADTGIAAAAAAVRARTQRILISVSVRKASTRRLGTHRTRASLTANGIGKSVGDGSAGR